jgi:hypothetical protein
MNGDRTTGNLDITCGILNPVTIWARLFREILPEVMPPSKKSLTDRQAELTLPHGSGVYRANGFRKAAIVRYRPRIEVLAEPLPRGLRFLGQRLIRLSHVLESGVSADAIDLADHPSQH